MISDTPIETPVSAPPRGNTLTVALVAGLIAFLAGLAVMAAVFRFGGWWDASPAPVSDAARPALSAEPAVPATDVATLAAREQALAARLDVLDNRIQTSDADARTAASYAGRAEAMMLVFGARRAIERGQPLGPIAGELRTRFGEIDGRAVATVIRGANEPVTLEDLRLAFDQIAPRLSTGVPGESWWDGLRREAATLVIVRKENAASPHPRARLARARRLLGQGHVEAALAEIARLPGAQGAESWMAAASRYVETRSALDTLETAAIRGPVKPAAGAQQPAAPAQPAAAQ
ncbi:MAG TPA: hypothetical protein VLG14_19645 [Sphingomonas sp.]|jgi:hypothetical protein|nr:hypothetical protein [Sphingomonas sp.]